MDTRRIFVVLAYMYAFLIKLGSVYIFLNGNGYKYLEVAFWLFFFIEHLIETVLWTTLATVLQLRVLTRLYNGLNLVDCALRFVVLGVFLCVVVILTLFVANDLDNAVAVLRQISLMLSMCGAIMEFCLVAVKALLIHDHLMIFSSKERAILMFVPCASATLSLFACGVPDFLENETCLGMELTNVMLLTSFLALSWFICVRRNATFAANYDMAPLGADLSSQDAKKLWMADL